jgi:hypothetical protein
LIPEGADTPTRVSRKILPGHTQNGLLAPPERRSSGSSRQGNRAGPPSDCQPSAVQQAVTVPSKVSVQMASDAAECTIGTGEKGVEVENGELNLGNFARPFKVSQSVLRFSNSQFCCALRLAMRRTCRVLHHPLPSRRYAVRPRRATPP